jgi:hypothetical protein
MERDADRRDGKAGFIGSSGRDVRRIELNKAL